MQTRNCDALQIPNTLYTRAWSRCDRNKVEMDNMYSFRLAIQESKALKQRWKCVWPKPRRQQKRATLTLIGRAWWFVFHPCMISETHHMALVSSSCSKGSHPPFFFAQMVWFLPISIRSSSPTSSAVLSTSYSISHLSSMHWYKLYQTIQPHNSLKVKKFNITTGCPI